MIDERSAECMCQEASYSELLASLKITLREALFFNREASKLFLIVKKRLNFI